MIERDKLLLYSKLYLENSIINLTKIKIDSTDNMKSGLDILINSHRNKLREVNEELDKIGKRYVK